MSFRTFVNEASSLVRVACGSLGYSAPVDLEWDVPPSKDMGDISFRVGFQLSKIVRKSPAEVAEEIARKIRSGEFDNAKEFVSSAEASSKGFLNFRLNAPNLFSALLDASIKANYGSIDLGRGQSVLVEHTSVNPNKALHVGHLRNLAVGDSIARILAFTNHSVNVLNYIDDSGLQVADIVVGIKYAGHSPEAPADRKYDHYAGDDIYVDVNRRYEFDPLLKEKQKIVLRGIEMHDHEIFPLAASITDKILKEQLKTCWRFNASYDLLVYESDIIASKLWEEVFLSMKESGIAKLETEGKLAGCWIVSIKGEKEGEDKVLVRSDGTATYVAKDIPFAALKTGLVSDRFTYRKYLCEPDGKQLWRTSVDDKDLKESPVHWSAEKSITAIGSEQSRLQRVVVRILGQLAHSDFADRYIHLGYAFVFLSQETVSTLFGSDDESQSQAGAVRMSGRKGLYVNADDVYEAVKKAAIEETKKRNPETKDENWYDDVAEKLALSAIRFTLLKQDLDKTITFDLGESLKLIGETGPYMLYTYARAMSILSKVTPGKTETPFSVDAARLSTESELDLLTTMSKYDYAVEKSVKMLTPKWIAHYAFELCEAFNKFYEKNRVIQIDDLELRGARVRLVAAFSNVLKSSLGLLGIEVLPKI